MVAAKPDAASQTQAQKALGELCRAYWYPLYAFVRNRGYSPTDAEDLTQSFFARLIETRGFASAEPERGRFRSYLLGALKHFLAHDWEHKKAKKRGGDVAFLELDSLQPEARYAVEPASCDDPDAEFNRQWAQESIARAIETLRARFAAKGKGEFFETLKGSLTGEELEKRIRELKDSHRHIWFLADGVYSMYGDLASIEALSWLLSEYEQLHLYIDDAHGMSWRGENGRGYALEELTRRERCVAAVSLNKAFGAGGGALVFDDPEQCRKVRHCGGPMIFTGPIQPPILAAAVASAQIHLSDEIEHLQGELRDRVLYANQLAGELGLPFANYCEVPIRFIALGKLPIALEMTEHLLARGLLVNAAVFPAVPAKKCGVRFTITRHQRLTDIRLLLETVAEHLPKLLVKHGSSLDEIVDTFHLSRRGIPEVSKGSAPPRAAKPLPRCHHETTIEAISRDEWDRCLGVRGSFSWDGLRYLESVFGSDAARLQDRWNFHYYIVRDEGGEPVLATFFTESLWKDDMLSEASVSRRVESHRAEKPTFMTSRVFSMGSLLTEGNHLYLDREANWKPAVASLLEQVAIHCGNSDVASVVLRDLDGDDEELDRLLRDAGYSTIACPDSMVLDVDWSDWDEFLSRLSGRARRFQKRYVAPRDGDFSIEVLNRDSRRPSEEELEYLYRLYLNVKERNLELNTFPLPENFLSKMLEHPGWEIVTLTLKPSEDEIHETPQAFVAAYVGPERYVPAIVGLDYRAVGLHGSYRQCIRQVIRRAESHGSLRIELGMGAELEKERFGARRLRRSFYIQSLDHYQHDVLSLLAMETAS